jgi:hypothetical protein
MLVAALTLISAGGAAPVAAETPEAALQRNSGTTSRFECASPAAQNAVRNPVILSEAVQRRLAGLDPSQPDPPGTPAFELLGVTRLSATGVVETGIGDQLLKPGREQDLAETLIHEAIHGDILSALLQAGVAVSEADRIANQPDFEYLSEFLAEAEAFAAVRGLNSREATRTAITRQVFKGSRSPPELERAIGVVLAREPNDDIKDPVEFTSQSAEALLTIAKLREKLRELAQTMSGKQIAAISACPEVPAAMPAPPRPRPERPTPEPTGGNPVNPCAPGDIACVCTFDPVQCGDPPGPIDPVAPAPDPIQPVEPPAPSPPVVCEAGACIPVDDPAPLPSGDTTDAE